MECKKCGIEINHGDKFCKNCGNIIEDKPSKVDNHQTIKKNIVKKIITKEDKDLLFCPLLFSSKKILKKKQLLESLPITERSLIESIILLRNISLGTLLLVFCVLFIIWFLAHGVTVK